MTQKKRTYSLRVTEDEYAQLDKIAKLFGVDKSEVVRKCINGLKHNEEVIKLIDSENAKLEELIDKNEKLKRKLG